MGIFQSLPWSSKHGDGDGDAALLLQERALPSPANAPLLVIRGRNFTTDKELKYTMEHDCQAPEAACVHTYTHTHTHTHRNTCMQWNTTDQITIDPFYAKYLMQHVYTHTHTHPVNTPCP